MAQNWMSGGRLAFGEAGLPGEDSFEDRYNSFYDSLYREIKKKFYFTC